MSGSVIADNWSLQTVAELLDSGLDESAVDAILFDKASESHSYAPLPNAAVSFEALFDLIADLVLRDQLLVDEAFTNTWKSIAGVLDQLSNLDLIRPVNFLNEPERLNGPRSEFVDRLCVTQSIRAAHQKNTDAWDQTGIAADPLLSTTLWGGAGMLARAFVNEKGYTPHPLRRRLFQQANVVLRAEDTAMRLTSLIREKRASFSKSMHGNDALYSLRLSLPPIPIRVIREAQDASQLLPIALQLRDEFQELRGWLGEYQAAITNAGQSERAPFDKILRSISTYIDSRIGLADPNAPTFTIGVGVLKVAFKARPIEFIKNQFGVRANVNRLVLSDSGSDELNRLLGFFDHRHSSLAVKVIEHFRLKS